MTNDSLFLVGDLFPYDLQIDDDWSYAECVMILDNIQRFRRKEVADTVSYLMHEAPHNQSELMRAVMDPNKKPIDVFCEVIKGAVDAGVELDNKFRGFYSKFWFRAVADSIRTQPDYSVEDAIAVLRYITDGYRAIFDNVLFEGSEDYQDINLIKTPAEEAYCYPYVVAYVTDRKAYGETDNAAIRAINRALHKGSYLTAKAHLEVFGIDPFNEHLRANTKLAQSMLSRLENEAVLPESLEDVSPSTPGFIL